VGLEKKGKERREKRKEASKAQQRLSAAPLSKKKDSIMGKGASKNAGVKKKNEEKRR